MTLEEMYKNNSFEDIINTKDKENLSEYEQLVVTKSYFELGHYDVVKKLIDKYIYEHKYYYEYLILRVEILLSEEKLIDVAIIIREELNMPYLEDKYKNYFQDILDVIISKQYNYEVTDRDIEELMLSEDKENQILAISLLRKQNLRNYVEFLKEVLVNSEIDLRIKNFCIDLFSEQDINLDVELSFDSYLEEINTIEYSKSKNDLIKKLEKTLAFNETNIQNSVKEVITIIIINTYPLDITFEQYAETINSLLLQMFNKDVVNDTTNMELLDYFKSLVF